MNYLSVIDTDESKINKKDFIFCQLEVEENFDEKRELEKLVLNQGWEVGNNNSKVMDMEYIKNVGAEKVLNRFGFAIRYDEDKLEWGEY